jgi:pheromone shutdown-related protein TraB
MPRSEAEPSHPAPEPPRPPEPVALVTRDGVEYTLLGTAHVSRRSEETVRRMLDEGSFDAVAVELCASRHRAITDRHAWADLDLFRVLREGKAGMMMAGLALGAYQRRIAEQLGSEPGGEMKAAIEGAAAHGVPLLLIDREIGVTLRRTSRRLPWWQRWGFGVGLFLSLFSKEEITEEEIERLKETDVLAATFREVAEGSPALFGPLIAERDRYMAARLRRDNAGHPGRRVLVVVGAGHLDGLARALREGGLEPATEIAALEHTPPPSLPVKVLPWAVVLLVAGGFVLGFTRSPELGWSLVATWVVANGTLSALGALLASAHPVTILSAFLAAPLTSLNPTVGAGVVTASVECWLRRPTIGDFETLRDDVAELPGWRTNGAARIFLVFLLSSLGSIAGTWLAGARMFVELF